MLTTFMCQPSSVVAAKKVGTVNKVNSEEGGDSK